MKKIFIYILAISSLASCKRNLKDVSWDTEVIAPLLTTSLTIEDLIKDDPNFVRSGKEISFVYKKTIDPIGLDLDTIIQLGVKRFQKTVNLETLELPEQKVSDTIFLGDIGPDLALGDGSSFPAFFFNAFPASDLGTQTVDFSEYLTSAEVSNGNLTLEIENQLDVVIETITLKVENDGDGFVIFEEKLTEILTGETKSIERNLVDLLQGNTLEGRLKVQVLDVKFRARDGATRVVINYEDYIRYDMSITNMKVTEATAIFQNQEVLNSPDTTSLQGMEDVILTGALIDTGYVNVRAYNTVSAVMDFQYDLIGLTDDSGPFNIVRTLEANDSLIDDILFTDSYLYLKGNPNGELIYNSFYSELLGNIRTTSSIVNISLEDSISIDLGFDDIRPKYVEGYLGQDTFGFRTGVPIDAWNDFPIEELDFKSIDLRLFLENGLGVPAQLTIKELKAVNTKTGATHTVANIVSDISRAIEVSDKLTAVETEIKIPGATELINIKPDSLIFDFEIITNPKGNDGSYSNFLERISYVRPSAKIEIPFELSATGFSLNDTVDFSVSNFEIPDLLRDEKLVMIVDNNIPASGTVKASFLTENGSVIDEISTPKQFISPSVSIEGEAIDVQRSSFVFEMPKDRLEKILKAKKVVYTVNFSTSTMIDFVKILSDNSLKVTLIGDAGLHIETKEF